MEKRAILIKGEANNGDNVFKFRKAINRDISIMEGLAMDEGYSIKKIDSAYLEDELKDCKGDKDLLLYFAGHAKDGFFEGYNAIDLFEEMNDIYGRKTIILDACAGGEALEKAVLPKNSKLFTANEVPLNRSIAMMFWDSIEARKTYDLNTIGQDAFNEMKQQWVYVKERK